MDGKPILTILRGQIRVEMKLFRRCKIDSTVPRSHGYVLFDMLKMHLSDEPPAPDDFGNGFTLPKSMATALQQNNPHEMDSRIEFDWESHTYTIDGVPAKTSVTQLVGSHFAQFNADKAIQKMKSGPNWPRQEYQLRNGSVMSDALIKSKWDSIATYSRNTGSWMHFNIERYFNGLQPSRQMAELSQLYDFEREVLIKQGITPFRTEWRIAAPELQLAGTVDFVGRMADGNLVIIDWKRSMKLQSQMTSPYSVGRPPLSHLPDCEGSKYLMQLNTYKYILTKYYNLNVSKMMLVSLHPKLTRYYMRDVADMNEEVVAMIYGDSDSDDGKVTSTNESL